MNEPSLNSPTEQLFNLKFAAKELQRNSKKCDKEEKAEKAKVKQVGSFGCELQETKIQEQAWLQSGYDT